MLTLLQPLWLLATAGVVVPVAIHLLSRGRGRRRRVGSVRWIPSGTMRSARALRLERPWLLALRCLLLVVVAVALAGPRAPAPLRSWRAVTPAVLVSPELTARRAELAGEHGAAFDRLDELLAGGEPLPWPAPAAADDDLWSRLRAADAALPAGRPLAVFVPNRAELFAGARPRIARPVEWRPLALPPEPAASEGQPAAGGVPRERPGGEGMDGGAAGVEGGDGSRTPAGGVATRAVAAVVLSHPERAADARTLRAALEAGASSVAVELTTAALDAGDGAAAAVAGADFVAWLSPDPVPAAVLSALMPGAVLLSDVLERSRPERLLVEPPAPAAGPPLRFDRVGPTQAPDGEAGGESSAAGAASLWSDASGAVVLEAESLGDAVWLRFGARFDPAWTDLVLRPELPRWLAGLLRQPAAARPPPAGPPLDPAMTAPGPAADSAAAPGWRWPESALWALAAALFGLERRLGGGPW